MIKRGTYLAYLFLFITFTALAQSEVENEINKVINLHFSSSENVYSKIEVKYKKNPRPIEQENYQSGYLALPRIEEKEKKQDIEKISVSLFHRSEVAPSASASLNQSLKKLYPGTLIQIDLFKTRELVVQPPKEPEVPKETSSPLKEVLPPENIYEKNFGLILICGVLLVVGIIFSIAFRSAFKALSSEISAGAKSLATPLKVKTEKTGNSESEKVDELEFVANLKMAKEIISDYTGLLTVLISTEQDVLMLKKTLPLLGLTPGEVEDLMLPTEIRDKMNQKSVEKIVKKSDHQNWLQEFVENAIVNLSRASGPVLGSLGKEKKNKLKLIDKDWIESKLQTERDPLTIALCLELCSSESRKRFLKDHSGRAGEILSVATGETPNLFKAADAADRLLGEFENQGDEISELDFSLLAGESIDWIVDYTKKLSLEEEENYLREITGDSIKLREKIRAQYWTMNDFIREMGDSLFSYVSGLSNAEKFSLCVVGTEELRKCVFQTQVTDKARVIFADKVKKEREQSDTSAHIDICRRIIANARVWLRENRSELSRAA